jgi:hypothetical protein
MERWTVATIEKEEEEKKKPWGRRGWGKERERKKFFLLALYRFSLLVFELTIKFLPR